jgi:hypothetical protein
LSNTYRAFNVTGVNSGGGSNPPYSLDFVSGDWSINGDVYEFQVNQSTHTRGASIVVQVFELVGGNYSEVITDVQVTPTGDITLSISSVSDLRFDGRIIIAGA